MVLPTQRLVPDPRRTKTCLDFGLSLSSENEGSFSDSLGCDDVETDISRKALVEDSRVRVGKLVQYLDRDVGQSSQDLLESVCGDFGYSDEEYSCLKLSKGTFCSSHLCSRPATVQDSEPRHSLDHADSPTYFSDTVTRGLAQLTFRTNITSPGPTGLETTPTLMKVHT